MKQLRIVLTVFAIFLLLNIQAQAEPASEPSATEQALLKSVDAAAAQALQEAEVRFSPSATQGQVETAQSTVAKLESKSTDVVLDELVQEVERLRSKNTVTRAAALSTQRPRSAKLVGTNTVYDYKPGAVYEVYTAIDRVTDLQLKPGESLSNVPVAGDTVRWKIAVIKSGNGAQEVTHVIVKPLDTELETNFILTTDKHTYHIRAISSDWYMPSVSWNYPQDAEELRSVDLARKLASEAIKTAPDALHFEYHLSGDDYPWKPLRVFDDGAKTYIQMPKGMRVSEAPALFVVEDDEPLLVNYRVKGDYYIVDRLFDQAELRVGTKKHVDIYTREAMPSFFERLFE
jgi:P-type conjugative transfer protein TrbG